MKKNPGIKKFCDKEGMSYFVLAAFIRRHPELQGLSYDEVAEKYRCTQELCSELGVSYRKFTAYMGHFKDEFSNLGIEEQLKMYAKIFKYRETCRELCEKAGVRTRLFFLLVRTS